MAKIELKKVLKEVIKNKKEKQEALEKMAMYQKKMDDGLAKLKAMMRRDGYNV